MKKLISRILFTLTFCVILLISFLLNPGLAYGNSTEYENITIYHNDELNPEIKELIKISLEEIKAAKIYSPDFHSQFCLNEGLYPKVVRSILGDDVFRAFSNKIVFHGDKTDEFNKFRKWERALSYTQFLKHALMHNLQFKYHGLWDANPLGGYPEWKWEGYVEYETIGNLTTLECLVELINDPNTNDFDWINLTKNEGTLKQHIKYLALVKYCFEILEWDYDQLMGNEDSQEKLLVELMNKLSK